MNDRGDSDVLIYDGQGHVVGVIDVLTRERRDLAGKVVQVLRAPVLEGKDGHDAPYVARKTTRAMSPSVPWQRQYRTTRIKRSE